MANHKAVLSSLQTIQREDFAGDENARVAALIEARRLCGRLETDNEKLFRMVGIDFVVISALQTGVDMGLFLALGTSLSAENLKGKTVEELSAATKTDSTLLKRVLNVLVAEGTITEHADQTPPRYAPTSFAVMLTHPYPAGFISFNYNTSGAAVSQMPNYLKSIGYRNPSKLTESSFQYAYNVPGQYLWDWVEASSDRNRNFQNMMSFLSVPDILAAVGGDTKNEIQKKAEDEKSAVAPGIVQTMIEQVTGPGAKAPKDDPKALTLVDVGGGQGHDALNFAAYYPGTLPGRVVLQDTPAVIENALKTTLANTKVEGVGHSFLDPMPETLHGSRLYHLGAVLHDWPDEWALKILANVAKCMIPGYSQLLLHERVVPETNVDIYKATMDWWMMAHFSSGERTKAQYDKLMRQVGLKIVKVINDPGDPREIVVCEHA